MKIFLAIAASALCLVTGCSAGNLPGSQSRSFLEKLNDYPPGSAALKIPRLTGMSSIAVPAEPGRDVFIMVHPAYSLFFRFENRSRYGEAKYALLAKQFEHEAQFITGAAKAGKILLLIIPGNYSSESIAPPSYTAYLNRSAAEGKTVFYLFSESARSGSISMNDMVDLYRFLQGIKTGRVLIGGGYIGRCQREFYNSLTAYFEKSSTYVVPELSTISPDDISEAEADLILKSITVQDYSPVRKLMEKKLDSVNIASMPRTKEP